jgi:hypothetical protein
VDAVVVDVEVDMTMGLPLSFTEERTAPEIAAELSLTEGNVRVIRHRALLRLRACLEGGAGPDGPAAPGERGGGEGS